MTEATINFNIQTHQTQFKIPIELIKKNFKNVQKLIEKQKKQLSDDIGKINKNTGIPTKLKLEMIRKLIKNFENFQKKLRASIKNDQELRSRLVARIENLKSLEKYALKSDNESDDDKVLDLHNLNLINWYRNQTNLLIIDYLIRSNTKDENVGMVLLKNLAKSNPTLLKLIDYDLFEEFNKVYISIFKNHDLSLITSWYNENKNSLKKLNTNMEFEINYCKFLNWIENGDINEAVKFSREFLSSYGNKENYPENDHANRLTTNLDRLTSLGGLLVFRSLEKLNQNNTDMSFSDEMMINSPQFKDFQNLLSDERWESLSQCFIENFTKLYGISKNYPIFIYLSAGLSSLKTKSCYHNDENTIFIEKERHLNNIDETINKESSSYTNLKFRGPNQYYKILNKINNCPVCSPELFKLSRNLPYAQLITSIFNNPFKLPNGNIYPFDKLLNPNERYSSEKNELMRNGKIKDPLTREIFLIDSCVRVFPA